uniref:G_PROTEIN_RECEP_F1_2 domain-containing protein n=1 Tax=Meloidogyne hapla TaxID=6305 RepID=A0A1I8C1A9_MELHA
MTSNSKSACEIGTLEMPPLEWLFTAVAAFQQNYGQIHPYLAVGLCIAGTIMNFVTVLVLTRPSMRSPVNVLLCAVACCDILVEVSYLIFVLHFLLASAYRCEPSDFSWWWAVFMMFHAHASVIFHAASIWMLVVMAQLRVLTIRRATKGPTTPLTTERFTALIALLTTLVSL